MIERKIAVFSKLWVSTAPQKLIYQEISFDKLQALCFSINHSKIQVNLLYRPGWNFRLFIRYFLTHENHVFLKNPPEIKSLL